MVKSSDLDLKPSGRDIQAVEHLLAYLRWLKLRYRQQHAIVDARSGSAPSSSYSSFPSSCPPTKGCGWPWLLMLGDSFLLHGVLACQHQSMRRLPRVQQFVDLWQGHQWSPQTRPSSTGWALYRNLLSYDRRPLSPQDRAADMAVDPRDDPWAIVYRQSSH
jgi:hypothetical protein